jgi:cytochrome c-type biogenesis protein CcmH
LVVCLAAGAAVPAALALPPNGSGTSRAADAADAAARLGPRDWLALGVSLDRRGDPAGAERAYRRALALVPRDAAARTRLAFDLMRAGHLAPAERLVRPVAARRGPYRPLALLVLGLAERGRGEAAATATLRRFLQVAPHHPAAVQVRRLLGGRR